MSRFSFWSAIFAGFIAVVVMTVVSFFLGIDIIKMLGMVAGMTGMMVYIVGGIIHLLVGLVYALIYALIFEPLFKGLPKFLSGAIYSLLPFIIAITLMGSFTTLIQNVFGVDNYAAGMYHRYPYDEKDQKDALCQPKCHPEYYYRNAPQSPSDINPADMEQTGCRSKENCVKHEETCPVEEPVKGCVKKDCPKRECDRCPCKAHPRQMMEPQKASKSKYMGYSPGGAMDCAPCGAGKGMAWLWSLISHLVYGTVLGLCYIPKKKKTV